MKKKVIILLLLVISLFMIGCGKNNKNVISKLENHIKDATAYHMKGNLEIVNNEDTYVYDVDIAYRATDLFRVSLKNTNNNHVQILLKNADGVYVLTPSLNKSFKFQSDWPYNNSQIYLLQTILKDIQNDNSRTVEQVDDGYTITSKVNYSNNEELVKQKVYINNNYDITKVEVMNASENILMTMTFTDIDMKPNLNDEYFAINSTINTSIEDEEIKEVSKIDTIIYPMYMPENTYLASQNKLDTDNGERVILTFEGDNPFMFIQETAAKQNAMTTIPMYGSPEHIGDSIGAVSDNSISWTSGGIDYYVTSDSLSEQQLVSVANSINAMPVGK